ncbi:hypothetical protein GCM10010121_071830 [Streptomyces brasiliensis]|uniref:Uncharacterized protein n=1 Tax=Streptomyces brasiliensis TaxID=1954 RepID=A0A917L7J6_9ACTN|nr:hypothetical protein GCM10010121_071830 [Streptomyces brasiliensis]
MSGASADSYCIPRENDENIHQVTRQPLPGPDQWPVPPHLHLCDGGKAWPVHVLMGGGNPYLFLWERRAVCAAEQLTDTERPVRTREA